MSSNQLVSLSNNELLMVMLELNKISESHTSQSNLNENISDHVLSSPGKQLRPALTIVCSKLWQEDIDEKVIKMSTAVELLHIATLVHDDTVDFADTRRGEKTASNIWGPHIAVLVGDFLFATSAEYVCDTQSIRLIKQFASTISDLAKGQLKEIENKFNIELNLDDYLDIIFKKTGSLFATSSMSGALLGGAVEEEINNVYQFGKNLGLGFQIYDDALDFEGDEKKMGKPVGSDLKNGVMTLPSIIASKRNEKIKKEIINLFELKEENRNEEVDILVKKITNEGYVEEAKFEASKLIDRSLENISSLKNNNIYKESLINLAISSKDREK